MTGIEIPPIEEADITKLRTDGNNPNAMSDKQLDALVKNIAEFGFLVPIITNEDYLIADGEHRLRAAKKLGMTKVPVIRLQIKEVDRRILRQVMNKLKGEHDKGLDAAEFKAILDEESNFSRLSELLGKEEVHFMAAVNKEVREEDDKFDVQKALERPKYTVSPGQLWQLGDHLLMCGDSTKEKDVKTLLGENIPILMVTDPPYGVNYDPKWRDEADKKGKLGNRYPTRSLGSVENDDKIDWSDAYQHFNGDIAYIWHAGIHTKAVTESIEKLGYNIISQIVWAKPHFALSRGDYHWQHEPCLYAVRKGKKHNWQGSRKETTLWEIAGMNAMGASHDEADKATGHGTQKPLECMVRPILNNSAKGEGVYDPFGGSGTTLIGAERHQRTCYMMEIDPIYCSIIIERWESFTGKKAENLSKND